MAEPQDETQVVRALALVDNRSPYPDVPVVVDSRANSWFPSPAEGKVNTSLSAYREIVRGERERTLLAAREVTHIHAYREGLEARHLDYAYGLVERQPEGERRTQQLALALQSIDLLNQDLQDISRGGIDNIKRRLQADLLPPEEEKSQGFWDWFWS